MQTKDKEKVRQAVRESYGKIAKSVNVISQIGPVSSCCATSQNAASTSVPASCCGGSEVTSEQISGLMGYSKEDILSVPEGANMGLGCGNPVALASLKPGETVVDLGSGGGFDCFLAAKQVGESGQVIRVPAQEKRGIVRFTTPLLGADEWPFICEQDIASGDRVIVKDISGNTLIVEKRGSD